MKRTKPLGILNMQGMDKIMETPDSLGLKYLCWLHCKNISCEDLSLFVCLFMLCSTSVSALQTVFFNSSHEITAKWDTCQIFKEDRLLVRV